MSEISVGGKLLVVRRDLRYGPPNVETDRLDLYLPVDSGSTHPIVLYFHGGGWNSGSKEGAVSQFQNLLEQGWAAASVDFRPASIAPAPAAVVDARCALGWIGTHAAAYRIDPRRIVLMGNSSGGQLALSAGMLTDSAGFDGACPGGVSVRAAAVISWFGVTDVAELFDGPARRRIARNWIDGALEPADLARRISPVSMVRGDLPPIIMIHGEVDPIVPVAQGLRLHRALDSARVPNQLVVVPGRGHGHLTPQEMAEVWQTIDGFLRRHGVMR